MLTTPLRNRTFRFGSNGVIENYLEIRKVPCWSPFQGQTDTEIAVHLIGKFVEEDGLSTLEAFKKALPHYPWIICLALVVLKCLNPIYVAKNKSPLLIGLGDGYNMVCSDAIAMIRETNQYMKFTIKS